MPDRSPQTGDVPTSPIADPGRIAERMYRRYHDAKRRNGWRPPDAITVHEDELRPLAEVMVVSNLDLPADLRERDRKQRVAEIILSARSGEALLFGVPVRVRPLRPLFVLSTDRTP